jgi:hypothetical protein
MLFSKHMALTVVAQDLKKKKKKKKKKKRNWILKSGTNLFFIMFFKSYSLPLEDRFRFYAFYVFQTNNELYQFFFFMKTKIFR